MKTFILLSIFLVSIANVFAGPCDEALKKAKFCADKAFEHRDATEAEYNVLNSSKAYFTENTMSLLCPKIYNEYKESFKGTQLARSSKGLVKFVPKCHKKTIENLQKIGTKDLGKNKSRNLSFQVKTICDDTFGNSGESSHKFLEKLQKQNKSCYEEKNPAPKLVHGDSIRGGVCELRKVMQEGVPWKAWNGFDVFKDGKYLAHVHGKWEGKPYWKDHPAVKDKVTTCKPSEIISIDKKTITDLEEVKWANHDKELVQKYRDCHWVESQTWSAEVGCDQAGKKICVGKMGCENPINKKVKFYNVACQTKGNGECPAVNYCAGDRKFNDNKDSKVFKGYKQEANQK